MLIIFSETGEELIKRGGKKIVEIHSKYNDKVEGYSNMKPALRIVILDASVVRICTFGEL